MCTLFDYLEAGHPLSEFLDNSPTVPSEQAIAALEMGSLSSRTWRVEMILQIRS